MLAYICAVNFSWEIEYTFSLTIKQIYAILDAKAEADRLTLKAYEDDKNKSAGKAGTASKPSLPSQSGGKYGSGGGGHFEATDVRELIGMKGFVVKRKRSRRKRKKE